MRRAIQRKENAKKQILFVDDEPAILNSLRRILYREQDVWDRTCGTGRVGHDVWDMTFLDSPQEALDSTASDRRSHAGRGIEIGRLQHRSLRQVAPEGDQQGVPESAWTQ